MEGRLERWWCHLVRLVENRAVVHHPPAPAHASPTSSHRQAGLHDSQVRNSPLLSLLNYYYDYYYLFPITMTIAGLRDSQGRQGPSFCATDGRA